MSNSTTRFINLEQISKVLGSESSPNSSEYWDLAEKKEEAEEALLDLCEKDSHANTVTRDHELDRDGLRALYQELCANGAGQWVQGHYVAASVLASGHALALCLDTMKRGLSGQGLAFACIEYFEHTDGKANEKGRTTREQCWKYCIRNGSHRTRLNNGNSTGYCRTQYLGFDCRLPGTI